MSLRSYVGRWLGNRIKTVLERTQPRVITDRTGMDPYLSRYYVFGKPTMPDGSSPFDRFGNPKKGATWNDGIGLYVHKFHRSDADGELHNHPFKWSLAFVIAGGYIEERRKGSTVITRIVRPLSFNWISLRDFHRVDLIEKDAWTLFLVGPKAASWGFWNRDTLRYTPWREFLESQRAEARPS